MRSVNFLLIILSAFILGLAQQPIFVGWFAWIGLIPTFFILNKYDKLFDYVKLGLIWGFIYYFTVIFWLSMNIGTTPIVGFISMIAAVIYGSFNYIIIFFLTGLIKKKYKEIWIWTIPVIWTSVEYIRNMDILTGGPWTSIANTQSDYLLLIQNVEITGIYGITFWLLLVNVSIYSWIIKPYNTKIFYVCIIFIFPWITGWILFPNKIKDNKNKKLDIISVQPNIHLSEKWKGGGAKSNINILLELSDPFIQLGVDLIVWPESATSSYMLQDNKYHLTWIQSKLLKSHLITGVPYYTKINNQREIYNSVVMITSDSVSTPYHKMILVPMGEYIPLSKYFNSLKKLNLGQANFTHGKEYRTFSVEDISIATMICFESTIPSLSAKFVKDGAEVLVFVVNDGWYEHPPEPQQHAKQAIFRAIENRRPVIRSSNTGISMIIDHSGNIIDRISLNNKGVIKSEIIPLNTMTFYTQYGDIFAKMNVILSAFLILGIFFRRK